MYSPRISIKERNSSMVRLNTDKQGDGCHASTVHCVCARAYAGVHAATLIYHRLRASRPNSHTVRTPWPPLEKETSRKSKLHLNIHSSGTQIVSHNTEYDAQPATQGSGRGKALLLLFGGLQETHDGKECQVQRVHERAPHKDAVAKGSDPSEAPQQQAC